eukprot:TRINITY_DN5334_c0_g1_i1.p1 TRINITY_DN5334_c0_g1~~TRINITY_DN5334_c0_g1_i1.p1  ORF type:complete len:342 (-),score=51.97 TRINITY_DN5334_c0_g1_i1:34-1059(-)
MNTTPYSHVLLQPVFQELADCKRILFAGCGGGYDFFGGIPLYYAFKKAGAECFLANLTFTDTKLITSEKFTDVCWKVTPECKRESKNWNIGKEDYWPELIVTKWFKDNEGWDVPVYMIAKTGVVQLIQTYEKLVKELQLDAIVLVDGGTDSLLFGNEESLGTPAEDMSSVAAVHKLSGLKKKVLMNLGLGVDCYYKVSHSLWLENVSTLSKAGHFLGSFSLIHTMEEAKKFEQIYAVSKPVNSVVCSSILSAVKGEFGDHHNQLTKRRTVGSKLYITPLMSMYFAFRLDGVAEHILYLDQLYNTTSFDEISTTIQKYYESKYLDPSSGLYIGERHSNNILY